MSFEPMSSVHPCKKVLIITPNRDGFGGVEAFNRRLEKLLTELGCDVEIAAANEYSKVYKNKFCCLYSRWFGDAVFSKKALQNQTSKYDYVICSGEYGYGLKGNNLIAYMHGSYYAYAKYVLENPNFKMRLFYWMLAKFQKKSVKDKKVVCVSKFISDLLQEQGISVDMVIENCVDCQMFFNQRKKRQDYLFVGRYDYKGKGIDIIEALQNRIRIDVYTDRKCDNITHCIESHYSAEEMADIYNQYKILVFPSRFESSGLVSIEAMACGVPVIIFNVGIGVQLQKEIPEFVVDINNYTVDEFMKRINLIEDNYEEFCQKAREYACKHHSNEQFVYSIKKMLEIC